MSFLVLLITAGLAGSWVLRAFRIPGDAEGLTYRLLTGLSLCASPLLVIGSASLGAAHIALYVVAAVGLSHELFGRSRLLDRIHANRLGPARAGLDWVEKACLAAVAGGLGLALLSALAPATSWDAGVAHLALPAMYLREKRFCVYEGNAYSAYPQFLHCLYTLAMARGGELGAQLLSWTFAALGCAVAYCSAKRVAGRHTPRRAGLLAAALFATAPIFFDQAGAPSLDLAFAVVVLAALNALVAWRQERRLAWVAVAAVLAGSACGIRHTAYLTGLLLFVVVAAARGPRRLAATACFVSLAGLAALPWLLRSAVLVGNPFYPFLTGTFPSEHIVDAPITALAVHDSLRGTGLWDFVLFPWNLVMHPERYDGWMKSPGPFVLLLGLPGLLFGGKRARMLAAFSLAGGAALFFFRQSARYMLPMFVPMMVVAGAGACRLPGLRRTVAALLVAGSAYGLALGAGAVHFKAPAALGIEGREDYLARRVERYRAFEWVNESLRPKGVILTLDPRGYYFRGACYQNPEALKPLTSLYRWQQLEWLRERDITCLFVPRAYIEESPGFAQTGLLDLINQWRADTFHFVCVKQLVLDRPKGGGKEIVEIYEVRYGA